MARFCLYSENSKSALPGPEGQPVPRWMRGSEPGSRLVIRSMNRLVSFEVDPGIRQQVVVAQ